MHFWRSLSFYYIGFHFLAVSSHFPPSCNTSHIMLCLSQNTTYEVKVEVLVVPTPRVLGVLSLCLAAHYQDIHLPSIDLAVLYLSLVHTILLSSFVEVPEKGERKRESPIYARWCEKQRT
jgi:hypothetical protein